MKVKEKQAAQRQIDINTDSFKLKDQEEKLQAGRYIVELVSAVLAGREPDAKPEDLPVKAIYRMAKLHNLDCIVYDGMKRIAGEADADLMEEWANRNTICAAQGIMQQREAKKLAHLVTAMYKVALKKAKVVFFENAENRDVIVEARIIPKEKTHVLAGAGVDLEHFKYAPYPKDSEITRFLFVGRVMQEKGIDELFQTMQRLNKEGYKCMLDVVGGFEENYSEKIRKYEREGWLHYLGYQENVRPFIEKCHCFVLPSWHEGMANTNLECSAMGRPIITSNIHGCLEAVEDGVTGYLCEKQNPEDLYRIMKKICELSYEERKAMGLAGRKRMEDIFDKKKVVSDTIEVLKK